ncbi:MAG: hypothetical protein ACI8S3_001477 [Alphaproteobacteria bacterium]|jgi:hypothetical protein
MTITSPPLTQEQISAAPLDRTEAARDSSLFTPLIDFLCLGGGSLLIFIPMMFLDVGAFKPTVLRRPSSSPIS